MAGEKMGVCVIAGAGSVVPKALKSDEVVPRDSD